MSRTPVQIHLSEDGRSDLAGIVRKLYPVLNDTEAKANVLIRVIDESGEDYL